MQDLVGVGVADAAEQVRVGQRALQRVVLELQAGGEGLERRVQHLEAAGVVPREARLALDQVQRGTALGTRLGQRQHAVREFEAGEGDSLGARRAGIEPVQAPGDHEVQDEPEAAVEPDRDPLAEPAHVTDRASLGRADRGQRRAQQERRDQHDAPEWLADEAHRERLHVHRHVG